MSNRYDSFVQNTEELLDHLKSRTEAYHLSNLFFRDFHYAIISFAESKGKKISYGAAEQLAEQVIASLEATGILKPVKPGSWMLNYPKFKTQSAKPVASPKGAAPAGGTNPQASPVPAPASTV